MFLIERSLLEAAWNLRHYASSILGQSALKPPAYTLCSLA
jgi:hypothetical protein